jgi:histidinol phosphatase-like PHP family hydrolase
MEVIDASLLLLLFRPDTPVPAQAGGVPLPHVKERVEFLIATLDKSKTKLIVPTPALSEVLVRAGATASVQIVEHLKNFAVFRIEPFDERAAIEVAAMTRQALSKGSKRGKSDATWAKIKFDRQIVAIARVCGAKTIYSDDGDIRKLAKQYGINVIKVADLPLPPQAAQYSMELSGAAEESTRTSAEIIAEGQPPA